VFPTTRPQRCWFHKIANVLGALPKSAHLGTKKALAEKALVEIWNAEDRRHTLDAGCAFETAYRSKFGRAGAKIADDLDELLAFYDFCAEHWIHLQTTNPECTFATVRNRTKVTRGSGSRVGRAGDGGQVDRGCAGSLTAGQRPTLSRTRPRRRDLPERQTHRTTTRRPHYPNVLLR